MKFNYKVIAVGFVLIIAFVVVYQKGINDGQTGDVMTVIQKAEAKSVESAPKLSPVKAMGNRNAYFPSTEDLGPNEMRVISLGTAMPFQRPAQAAPSFLVELGNGDKFLFDVGTGAAERFRTSNTI
jgi:hypothetical protein